MSKTESEQERLKRLRDEQIRARDPLIKERQISQRISTQQRRKRQNEHFFKDAVGDVPHKIRGVYVGAVLGLIVMLVLPSFVEGNVGNILGIAAIPLFIIIGFLYGASFDWRDDLRDHMK